MLSRSRLVLATVAIVSMIATACGSSSKHGATGGTGGSGGSGKTYTVGVLADMTGLAASGNKSVVQGVEAGIYRAKQQGYNIKYTLVDTQSSPAGALSAAQQLVLNDHVFAVIAASSLLFAAASFLNQHNVPVIGSAEDGPEWLTDTNMFSPYGPGIGSGQAPVVTGVAKAMQLEGVTNVGILAYAYPTSALAARDIQAGAESVGLKVGYINTSFPLGGTNVGPVVLAMKAAGINGFVAPLAPNTALAAIVALRQQGVNLKGAFLYNGYGGDLIQAGPGALQDAQGVYFGNEFEPFEMNTPATQQFHSALVAGAGVTGDPTFAEFAGYGSLDILVTGLKAAGSNPTAASLITALNGVHNYNPAGLFGSHHWDLNNRIALPGGVDDCAWLTRLNGSSFELVPGGDPICGQTVPGKFAHA
jgi:ABC-type branched-subunit amino acid transport system substrate-binding protein